MPNRAPLAVIQQDLLDGTVSTTRILQKCVLLANTIGSTELRDWARRELDGYRDEEEDDLPPYRKIRAQLMIDGQNGPRLFNNVNIGPEDLPDFVQEAGIGNVVPLTHSLAELEGLAARDDVINLSLPGGDLIKKAMNHEWAKTEAFAQIHRVFWSVMPTAFQGVIEGVRTALADLVGEMLRVLPDSDITPPKELADQAVNFVNTGERATINLITSQAAGGSTSTATATPPKEEESWWTRTRKRGLVITVVALSAGVAGILNWLHVYPWQ